VLVAGLVFTVLLAGVVYINLSINKGATSPSFSSSSISSSSSSSSTCSSSSINGLIGEGGAFPVYEVLHSVQFAESAVNAKLILPDSTILGPSFTISGVRINQLPYVANYTGTNGTALSYIDWSVTLFVWDHTFTNGTTNLDIFGSCGIAIIETPAPPWANSSGYAQEGIAQTIPSCEVHNSTVPPTTQCTTISISTSAYIINENGLSVLVSPADLRLLGWMTGVGLLW